MGLDGSKRELFHSYYTPESFPRKTKPRYVSNSETLVLVSVASPGNHDVSFESDFLKTINITPLVDSIIEVDNKFAIIGLKYRSYDEARPIDSLVQYNSDNLAVIVLDHAPDCYQNTIRSDIDVQFSGHTHNGQI